MSSLSPVSLMDEIVKFHPCPEEEFASAFWHQEMMYLLEVMLGDLSLRHRELLDVIRNEELSSSVYCLYTPQTPVREVDVDRLRAEMPEVFDSVVHLRCSDAQKFIGRRRMYELCREVAGTDRVAVLEQVTLGDLSRALPAHEFERFVRTVNKPDKTQVIPIAELSEV